MQLSVQQQMTSLPKFRQHSGTPAMSRLGAVFRAIGQGSGLLSGSVSNYGRLSSELFRAVRLVVDTVFIRRVERDHVSRSPQV